MAKCFARKYIADRCECCCSIRVVALMHNRSGSIVALESQETCSTVTAPIGCYSRVVSRFTLQYTVTVTLG